MSLVEYRRKRQFDRTREPAPGRDAVPGQRPLFVVQLHHASRRHYDFRLQVGNTLKSWAVPKGPSFDPDVKRMAVEVEDHPIGYATFEGDIPKGQYGGGHVAQFDQGVWSTEGDAEAQLAKGHLRFELFGERLHGGWHLVRTAKPARQPQWLLFKDTDEWASSLEADDLLQGVTAPPEADATRAGPGKTAKRGLTAPPSPTPRRRRAWASRALKLPGARKHALDPQPFPPELAMLVPHAPKGDGWLHELKWDGYRLLAIVEDGRVRLWSRNQLDWTGKVPDIRAAVDALRLKDAILDGELIAGTGSREDFNTLQKTLSGARAGTLGYVLFDLLHVDGVDLRQVPLEARKSLLADVLSNPPTHLAFSTHVAGEGVDAFEAAVANGFEGIISKRRDSPYRSGRGDDWRKTKAQDSDEFAVVGYTPPKGRRQGIGSVLLATPDGTGGWRYAGRIGSGFDERTLHEIAGLVEGDWQGEPTVPVPPNDTDLRAARWFAPRFVVEAFVRGTGGNGLLRQASFKTLRMDKTVKDLQPDAPRGARKATARNTAAVKKTTTTRKATAPKKAASAKSTAAPTLTSPDKVLFPDSGITKQEVADYYAAVMPWLLPEIANRPLSVIRCPGGIAASCFFQKHHTAGLEHVDLVPLKEEDGHADYLVANDAAAVMELVQFNSLEFHPWGSHADTPDTADRIVFDLDPDESVPWKTVVASARQVRARLLDAGLESFVRTTGGKGLHVVVPLSPGNDWWLVKPFAHAFAEAMVQSEPLQYVATASKQHRKGKIFIDYLRNGRGATSVSSFSLRARDGAPVAMPLRWEELPRVASGDAFTLRNVPARLKRLKKHPWDGIETLRQDLQALPIGTVG